MGVPHVQLEYESACMYKTSPRCRSARSVGPRFKLSSERVYRPFIVVAFGLEKRTYKSGINDTAVTAD